MAIIIFNGQQKALNAIVHSGESAEKAALLLK